MGGTLPALVLCWVLPGGIARIPGVWTLWVPGWGARTELQHPACRASERNQSSSVAVETGGETQFLAASTSLPGILRTLASGGVKRSPPPHFPPLLALAWGGPTAALCGGAHGELRPTVPVLPSWAPARFAVPCFGGGGAVLHPSFAVSPAWGRR